ncbi:MAG: UDP-glucose 4-epimerase GalE [Patescibacteria group bacterium]|nr:UDP-glucose 4-epimerase GalE [Patescibacteria group bacterium]
MNVLVTGGAGFIGSVTVKKLLEEGHSVTVFDALENGHRQAVDNRAKFVQGDLRDLAAIVSLTESSAFDAVIHFAGYIESGESMANPLKFFENNVAGGINLLKALDKSGVRRIVFSSTAGVYGDGEPPFSELSPIKITSYYSQSKYFFEEILRSVSSSNGFKVAVLRYFNAAGALADGSLGESHNPETHLIPLVIQTALGRRGELKLYGTDYPTHDGTAVRDYIHVEDLAEAHSLVLKSLENTDSCFLVFNLGTGRGVSNREIIDLVKEVSGADFKVKEAPRRAGDWPASFADVSKVERELGWRAKRGLKEIVESAYLWHRTHPYGFSRDEI